MDNFNGEEGIKSFVEERIFEIEKLKNSLNKVEGLVLE